MRFTRVVLTGGLCLLLAIGLEFWAYPWAIYFGNFTFGVGVTLGSYLIMAVVVGLVTSAATFVLSLFRFMPAVGQALMTAVASLTALALLALILGPSGIDIPGTRASGIFFSEWKFMIFTSEISAPAALLAGLIAWFIVRREQRVSPATMH